MTIHYHGTPITPRAELRKLTGKFFCVSYASRNDVVTCHEIGSGVMLDNGAFSNWRRGWLPNWDGYYAWVEMWLGYHTTWAVIPDEIGGNPEANDRLIALWPHGKRGAPVWHLHESIDRLRSLCDDWPRVCFGSSGEYSEVGTTAWHQRVSEAFDAISREGRVPAWLHMLRGGSVAGGPYPFASVDSTNLAQNYKGIPSRKQAGRPIREFARIIETKHAPGQWVRRQIEMELTA